MEVPADYVMDMMMQAIDGRIDSLEKKLEVNHADVKGNIIEIKTAIKEFQTVCNTDMKAMDVRIKDYEQFKWKVIAFSGAVAVIAGAATKFIFS